MKQGTYRLAQCNMTHYCRLMIAIVLIAPQLSKGYSSTHQQLGNGSLWLRGGLLYLAFLVIFYNVDNQ